MKLIILGDCHFGMRNDSILFHEYYKKFYQEVLFPYMEENNITTIFQMGDLFDRRKYINFNSLYLAKNYFFDYLREKNITLHTILGNHDISYKNTLEVNSSSLLLNEYENVCIYQQVQTVSYDGIPIDIVPWICDENEDEIFEFIKNSKSQICFGHFEIAGFEMDRGNICHEGIDVNHFNRYDMVLSGHFHHKSKDKNIIYVGTPGEMTWADYNDERGFHVFDTDTRELEFIQNPYRMFHKITYDDGTQSFEYWKEFEFSALKNTYVKVVVLNKQNPYLFDTVVDSLYKASVADISIVENFNDNMEELDDDIVNQAEDTVTILNKYVDNLTLDVNSDKLKNLMKELYIEAINKEIIE